MIQEFSVENFLSFGERQSISFEATTSDKKYFDELTVEVRPGTNLLKVVMIYGPNASGKTNLLTAIQAVWEMLISPRATKDKPTCVYTPFALRKGQPTVFDITFHVDGEQYEYHISYDNDNVLNEVMYYWPNGVKALFYSREFNEIKFGETLGLKKTTEKELKLNTLNNHTVLSTFRKTTVSQSDTKIEKLYNWIRLRVHELSKHSSIMDIIEESDKDTLLKDFILGSLHVSDLNIYDLKIVEQRQNLKQDIIDHIKQDSSIPEPLKEELLMPVRKDIEFVHHTENGDFSLSGHMESEGTLYSLSLIRKFYDLTHSDCIYIIDEIGQSLHTDLVKHSIIRFIRNSRNSQLIFTTHNQLLLDEDFVRRDMVWIVEKSPETAETELIPVTDYRLHPNKSLFKSYNIGQLGGKPALGSTLIEGKEN